MTRHSAGIPEIADLTRSPGDEIGRRPRVGSESRNRGQRGIVDIGWALRGPKVRSVRPANEGSGAVVHDREGMGSGDSLEGVSLPKNQDQCGISNVRKAERRGTRWIGPVEKEIRRAIIPKSEGDALGDQVSTRTDQRGNGVRHRRQHEKAGRDAPLDWTWVWFVLHGVV